MLVFNKTYFRPSTFILVGIPGLEDEHIWISIPFCTLYFMALLGNCTILYIIKTDQTLHEPMYIFLSMLAVNDVGFCSTTVPKMLCIFWFSSHETDYVSCLSQIFFIHSLSVVESGILAAMAYDRYVAICYPLRYSSILTNKLIAKIGLAILIRAVIMGIFFPILVQRFHYFKSIVISHSYCEHMAVVNLVYGDTKPNNAYGLFVSMFIGLFDLMAIAWSYAMILRAVFKIGSKVARLKALSTCGAHICVILIAYVLAFFSFLSHRFGQQSIPHHVHIFLANTYVLLPAMLNPFVYGANTKQIRNKVLRMFRHGKGHV
ncbi:olfactory receptor 52K1-like [Rhinatrema bivittatum]|uniref:olfactory receptor 52K1-like n=1 Tax=Rhinatrema bivittatum TaxID=194408 RepID=UPI0011286090|nr:olfactory receptor 52K1-like [Rhinatrema bivittatum]